jgi:hypothetical protein
MFCFQCEQTAKGEGCTKIGVCGKQPEVAALQDLLVYAVKGIAQVAVEGAKVNVSDPAIDQFTNEAIFSTLTNVISTRPALLPWSMTLPGTVMRSRPKFRRPAAMWLSPTDRPLSYPRPTRPVWWPRAKRWASKPMKPLTRTSSPCVN